VKCPKILTVFKKSVKDASCFAQLSLTPWHKEWAGRSTCPCSVGDRHEKRTENSLEQKDKIKPGQFLLHHKSKHSQSNPATASASFHANMASRYASQDQVSGSLL